MSEIEKQFFETFGIEPKHNDGCMIADKYWANEELPNQYITFDNFLNCECPHINEGCFSTCEYAYDNIEYPQIIDRILLELICIAHTSPVITFTSRDIKNLKEEVLLVLCNYVNQRDIKHQVQALFKEIK